MNSPSDRLIVDRSLAVAILTDSHFWVPVAVLIFGTVLLVLLTY